MSQHMLSIIVAIAAGAQVLGGGLFAATELMEAGWKRSLIAIVIALTGLAVVSWLVHRDTGSVVTGLVFAVAAILVVEWRRFSGSTSSSRQEDSYWTDSMGTSTSAGYAGCGGD